MYFWKHQKRARLHALISNSQINGDWGWDFYWEREKHFDEL
jgi:hypothetical protein